MKTSNFLVAILAIALGFAIFKLVSDPRQTDADPTAAANTDATTGATAPSNSNAAYKAIMTRTSVRTYTDKQISRQQIDSLLRAAMAAPTARNSQPWQFVVISDRATLDSIAANCSSIKMAADAPLAIAVCGDMTKALDGDGRDYWVQDCSAATENLLVAANAMGLGAVWCGIYPIPERVSYIRGLLKLPADIIPLNIIPIGYPKAPSTPKEKFDSTRIHTNTYL